jgi:hypothetical protein
MLRIIFKTRNELAYKPGMDSTIIEFLVDKGILDGQPEPGNVIHLFTTLDVKQVSELHKRAMEFDVDYKPVDFLSYYVLECRSSVFVNNQLQKLQGNDSIEWAYPDPSSAIPPNIQPTRNPLSAYQAYLGNSPVGIGVSHAWKKKGGKGDSTVKFVDIEQGWMMDHECLDIHTLPVTGVNLEYFSDHGAAVMGIIMMRNNNAGGIGITPLTNGFIMSQYRMDGIPNTPDAILSALPYLDAGDILLLEAQVRDPQDGFSFWPVESCEANFDMIRLATAMGIIVIEPCGNGNINSSVGNSLDEYKNAGGQNIFDRSKPCFKDSGAIMVAAATSNSPHERMHYSNYGNRIDCFAWGEDILTAGMYPGASGIAINTYTDQFGGSSGAAAIIAGVAISLQGMMERNYNCRLHPKQMRSILGDPCYGTVSADGIVVDKIGVMPDLEKITIDFVEKFNGMENMIPCNVQNYESPGIQI